MVIRNDAEASYKSLPRDNGSRIVTTAMEEWVKVASDKTLAKRLASNMLNNEWTRRKTVQMIDMNLEAEFWLATGEVPSCVDIMRKLHPPDGDPWGLGADHVGHSRARMEFIKGFGLPIPCLELIEAIKTEGPSVELGAGSGYLAALVNKCGGSVLPTDNYAGGYFFEISFHMKVIRLAASTAVERFPNIPVLISWPSFRAKWPSRIANRLKPGNRLLYIGENGGCTACYSFENILLRKFKEVKRVSIPQWDGMHDHLRIFEKE